MFPKAKNMESSFRMIRMTCAVVVVGSFGFAGYAFYAASALEARAQQKIYILSSGKVLEALASDRRDNLPAEARDHIRTFHELFFDLDPDDKVISQNLSRALYMADRSAQRVTENLTESGFYSNLISGNMSERLRIDSIHLDTMSVPFYFRLYGVETITRTTSVVTRDLVTEGYLRMVMRSDNNPHGFLIERWAILSNRDLKVEAR